MFEQGTYSSSGGVAPARQVQARRAVATSRGPLPETRPSSPPADQTGEATPPPSDARDAQIAREVQGFRPFEVLFNQPTVLPYNQQTLIRFVIASKDAEEAKAEFSDTTGAVTTDQVKLGRQVRAQLTGPGDDVQIQIVGTDVRDISAVANTTFDWYVTPKSTETFKLTLRLFNRVYDGTRWIEVQGPPYVKEFQVSVSNSQKFQLMLSEINGWLALLGSSIVALFGLAFTRLRGRFATKKPA